jgi:hypothetical protein
LLAILAPFNAAPAALQSTVVVNPTGPRDLVITKIGLLRPVVIVPQRRLANFIDPVAKPAPCGPSTTRSSAAPVGASHMAGTLGGDLGPLLDGDAALVERQLAPLGEHSVPALEEVLHITRSCV